MILMLICWFRPIDREIGSRYKLDIFHLKQTIQKIMHRFLELYQDFVWKYQTVYCLYVKNLEQIEKVSEKSHDLLQMKRLI